MHASIRTLDRLLDSLPVSGSRRRQLGAFRGELSRALARDEFRPGRRSLAALLDGPMLHRYVELAESGELRVRLVRGGKPPTSPATNQARRDCLDLLLTAIGQPRMQASAPPWGRDADTRPPVALRPTPDSRELAALRRRLGSALSTPLDPGRARFTAMLTVVLDAGARAGELAAQQLADLDADLLHVTLRRHPQHGTTTTANTGADVVPVSALTTAALAQWLPARQRLTEHLQGAATALWVSLRSNHAGLLDDQGKATLRPPGLPLEERGLARAYATGRRRYELGDLLPPKLEQLRRATGLQHTP